MKVELLSHTPDALNLLLRTKNTRLAYESDPAGWTEQKRKEHLDYMKKTIQSSLEFVDYIFLVSGVTRAYTHQVVRHRHGSYQQEALRVVDARDHPVVKPETLGDAEPVWNDAVTAIMDAYGKMVDNGVPAQDARGILPTNITTSIVAKFNLRSLSEMAKLRLCTRTQGEHQKVFKMMRELVIGVHPWTEDFLDVYCAAHGTCCFANYGPKECPVWMPEMDNTTVRAAAKKKYWSINYEASPVAKDGMAQ